MATQKIEYQNKVAIDDVGVPEKNKITAENMNEIKEVVNNNADNADETAAAINSRIDTANNAINNIVENTYTKTETDEKLAQKADISEIPTDLSQLSNATTKFVNETQLQEENNKLKADHPDIEEEGTDLSLQGTGDFDLALSPKGNITQDGEPSPNNEIPVKVVDGEYEVEVENKNWFDTELEQGARNNVDGTTLIPSNDYVRTVNKIKVLPNTTYCISCVSSSYQGDIHYFNNYTFIGRESLSQNKVFTTPANCNYINIQWYKSGGILPTAVTNIQLEKGITVTPYTAHAEQTQTIDTSPNPLYSENDLYFKAVNGDSFYDSLTSEQKANLENGSWYVHNEYVEDILSLNDIRLNREDTTYWVFTCIGALHYNSNGQIKGNTSPSLVKCNYFKFGSNGNNKVGVYLNNAYLMPTKADFSTYEEASQWITQHNGDIYMTYPLETPTNTKITNTTLINSLEALSNMKAYQDQTNISQTHNEAQADMIINAKTIMSMRYLQNEIEELKQAILNS